MTGELTYWGKPSAEAKAGDLGFSVLGGAFAEPSPVKMRGIYQHAKTFGDYITTVTVHTFELAGLVEPASTEDALAKQQRASLINLVTVAQDLVIDDYHQAQFDELAHATQAFTPNNVPVLQIFRRMAGNPKKPETVMLQRSSEAVIRNILLMLIAYQENLPIPLPPQKEPLAGQDIAVEY
jgi:hypothetical protein